MVTLFDDKDRNICIAYEDEELILENPLPIRCIGIQVGIIEKPYDEKWENSPEDYLENEKIIKEDKFTIFINEQRKWCGKTSVFLVRETGMSGHFVGRIKGAKYRFDLQYLTWDFS